jgi:hypothetical protein
LMIFEKQVGTDQSSQPQTIVPRCNRDKTQGLSSCLKLYMATCGP